MYMASILGQRYAQTQCRCAVRGIGAVMEEKKKGLPAEAGNPLISY
jgi:hypothetical protein